MPIFVGTGDTSSRIRSNRVGFASHSANPGTASEGDVYFNSSDSGLRAYDGSAWSAVGAGGGTVEAVASGTLSNGQTVVVSSDGAVVGVSSTGSPQSLGTAVVFESANTIHTASTFDSSNNKIVIAYCDSGNSSYGTAVVGTVSGSSITFGTPVVFQSSASYHISTTYDSTNDRIVISYRNDGNSTYGTVVVGTVSGTSITFGTPVVFNSAVTYYTSTGYDSSASKVVIAYKDNGSSGNGRARVGTVDPSDNSISFGGENEFENSSISDTSVTFDSTNNKIVIAYRNDGNSDYGTAVVATVNPSNNQITFGTPVVFESARIANYTPSAAYDSNSGKVIISYSDQANSNAGTAVVGTVSGTSISFGTPVVFESGESRFFNTVIDSSANKVVITYQDAFNSESGRLIVGTVSGTSISFGTPVVFEDTNTNHISATFNSNSNKIVIAYQDYGNSSYGTAIVFKNLGTNLEANNFLGFSDAAYSNGATAKVQIVGSTDDAQTGLTTGSLHYVQNDGTLSTTAGTPSVVAGIALTDTKILIRK